MLVNSTSGNTILPRKYYKIIEKHHNVLKGYKLKIGSEESPTNSQRKGGEPKIICSGISKGVIINLYSVTIDV
jgi:hypothetical protein